MTSEVWNDRSAIVAHLAVEAIDLPQPELVDFLGLHLERTVCADRAVVAAGAVGIAGDGDVVARRREIFALEEVAIPLERRGQLIADERREGLLEGGIGVPRRR